MIVRIPLTQGKEAVIDAADMPLVAGRPWHAVHRPVAPRWYAAHTDPAGHTVYLHRLIMAATPEQVVTHVNGDGLDNRRANLRRWRKPKRRRPTVASPSV